MKCVGSRNTRPNMLTNRSSWLATTTSGRSTMIETLRAKSMTIKSWLTQYGKLKFIWGICNRYPNWKLPHSWNDYKQQLKRKSKQLTLSDLIVHIGRRYTHHRKCRLISEWNWVQTQLSAREGKNKPQIIGTKTKSSITISLKKLLNPTTKERRFSSRMRKSRSLWT